MEIKTAGLDEIPLLLPALLELRPHRSREDLKRLLTQQFEEGYRVIYIGDEDAAFSVAGFRIHHKLSSGKTLYVDDLATHSGHRKRGYAGMLLDELKEIARRESCDHFSLDSGFARTDAHRLYLDKRLNIQAFHFARDLKDLP